MFGGVALLFALLAYLAHAFSYRMRVYGAEVPPLDEISTLMLSSLGIFLVGIGYLVDIYLSLKEPEA
ncbi:MAG: hypothetical protein OHK0053_07340 [Microscillaceae bacterium]